MPLGIELAAAWVAMLPCAEIADEIERTIGFLETSMRDVPERHRSLRAAFDHSWRLLTDEQQRSFRQLSAFRGPFSREAAAAVAGADLGLLGELVSKSLVRRLELGRYELHELLRQYAADRLAEEPDEPAEARERHARFYIDRLTDRQQAFFSPRMSEARDEVRRDVSNLHAAAEWAVTQWDDDEARGALLALADFFNVHSWPEGRETFEHLAETLDSPSTTSFDAATASSVLLGALTGQVAFAAAIGGARPRDELALAIVAELRTRGLKRELGACLLAVGTTACYLDEYAEAVTFLEEGVDVSHSIGDHWSECASLSWLGFVRLLQDDLEGARTAFEACLDITREEGQPLMLAFSLSKLGLLADVEGDYPKAMSLHMEANGHFDAVGDRGGAGYALSRASVSAYCMGEYEDALRLGRAGYDAFADGNHRWGMIGAASRVGFALVALRDFDGARERFRWALEQARATETTSLALLSLSGIGVLLAREGNERRAAELLTFVFAYPGFPPYYFITAQPELDRLEVELASDDLAAARETAEAMDFDAAVTAAEQALAVELPAPRA
jgi:hypothetical protein